jgi:hypothetical protein
VLLTAAVLMPSGTAAPVSAAQPVTRVQGPVAAAVPATPKKDKKKHHKKKKQQSIKDMIRDVFGPQADEALAVARCESHFQASEVNWLGATGVFQIRRMHNWRVKKVHGKDLLDPMTNVRVAYSLMKDEGWRPWVCARMLGISSGRSSHRTRVRNQSSSWQWDSGRRRPRVPRSPGMSP